MEIDLSLKKNKQRGTTAAAAAAATAAGFNYVRVVARKTSIDAAAAADLLQGSDVLVRT